MVERGPLAPIREVRPPGEIDPDGELVARWRAGDRTAFEGLVRRHQARVFRLLLRMLGSREEAEDVAQETFLNLHRSGHRFRGEARFSTFVYRVAANAALNRRRSLGRHQAREGALAREGRGAPERPLDPEAAAASSELRGELELALRELAPALRLPVLLCDVEGLDYAEIARILELPEGTVKSRIHRGRRWLRERLGERLSGRRDERPGDRPGGASDGEPSP
jgi:RNA polymerase sigma-70 factor (ECF subfamily)